MEEWTSIRLRKKTRDNVEKIGRKGETFDDLVNKMLEKFLK